MQIEMRNASEMVVQGYVNAVGRESRVLTSPTKGKFVEIVSPKTFEKALLRQPNVELRFNHDKHLGSTGEHNLEVFEDAIGLYAKATITDPDVIARRHELRGWSFTFTAREQQWDDSAEVQRRTLDDIDLYEVSILDKTPAYIATTITSCEMRDDEARETVSELRFADDKAEVTEMVAHETEKVTPDFSTLRARMDYYTIIKER